ncbi:MAG TPA: hypothetical protein VKY81_04415 [Natronosporangium sp.]|nr:hypothetical protein [Natronosporangium sp.]
MRFTESAVGFVLQLCAWYPRRRLVFLNRDMEYHHTVAVRLGVGARVTSLDVSRAAIGSPLLRPYCLARGLADAGPVVLVDSGFEGNVAKAVAAACPEAEAAIHLLHSFDPAVPGSHFALELLTGRPVLPMAQVRARIEELIERRPHATGKVTGYVRDGVRVRPEHATTDPAWVELAGRFRKDVEHACGLLERSGAVHRYRQLIDDLVALLAWRPAAPVVLTTPAWLVTAVCGTPQPLGVAEFVRELRRLAVTGQLEFDLASCAPDDRARFGAMTGRQPLVDEGASTALRAAGWRVVEVPDVGDPAVADVQRILIDTVTDLRRCLRCGPGHQQPLLDRLDRTGQLRGGRGLIADLLLQSRMRQIDVELCDEASSTLWAWALGTAPGTSDG